MGRTKNASKDVVEAAKLRAGTVLVLWALLMLAIAAVFIVLAKTLDDRYYAGLLLMVPLAGTYSMIQRPGNSWMRLAALRREWGLEVDRRRNFELIEQRYRLCVGGADPPDSIDNSTWSDLDVDDVYARIDRTITTPGESVLYHMLRRPELDADRIEDRARIVRLLESDEEVRDALQFELLALDREIDSDLSGLLWGPRPSQVQFAQLFPLLTLAALAAVVLPLFWRPQAWAWLMIPVFLVNMVVTYAVRRHVLRLLSTLRYIGSLIRAARRIGKLPQAEISGRAAELARLAKATSPLAKHVLLLNPGRGASGELSDMATDYFAMYFLIEVRMYCRVIRDLDRHLEDLRRLHALVGELDALQSVASYRAGCGGYCEPVFVQEGPLLELTDACHPLLDDPVPNSISIRDKGVFISGSNMAGKSTFLRTVAVNVMLAQAIGTCCAAGYRGSLLRIISSIHQADELGEGKSYYLKEAERLHTIIQATEGPTPPLCIIDELLKGTNSAERFSASVEILGYLCRQRAIVLVASHDMELARTMHGHCDDYHFADQFAETGLQFDYQLRPGIASTRNAITLLGFLGYPPEIVDAAKERLAKLEAPAAAGRDRMPPD